MFKEFNVQFQDAQIVGGADNLLENTKVTKVVLRGDNNLSSLDSAFKNCSELDIIEGAINLDGISDIDNLLDETPLVKEVTLENINTEISAKDSFNDVNTINIDGNCTKEGIQSFLGNFEWDSRKHKYVGEMENTAQVLTEELNGYEDREIIIDNSTEYSAKGVEIYGQTYQNLVDGKNENIVKNEWTLNVNDGSGSKDLVMDNTADLDEIQGQTYQNLISNASEEKDLVDPFEFTATSNSDGFSGGFDVFVNEIQGNTVQDTIDYSISNVGELFNLFDVNKLSSGIGDLSVNGNEVTVSRNHLNAGLNIVDGMNIKPSTSYTFKAKIKDVSSGVDSIIVQHYNNGSFFDENKTFSVSDSISFKFTTPSELNNLRISVLITAPSFQDLYVTFYDIILVEGNYEGDYVPYGSYKVEIECANKNFADINKPSGYVNTDTHTYSDGVVTISCNESNQVHVSYTFNLNIPKGQSYSVQAQVVSSYGGEDGTTDLGLSSCNIEIWEDNVWVSKRWSSNSSGLASVTRTVSKDISEVKVRFGILDSYFNKKTFSFKDLQFELGSKTSYENRTTNKTTFILPHPLRRFYSIYGSKPIEYSDKLYWDENKGHYCIEKNIDEFNTGNISYTGSLNIPFPFPDNIKSSLGSYSDYPFIINGVKTSKWDGSHLEVFAVKRYNSDNYIRLATSSQFTNEQVSEKLSNKSCIYVMTSPEIIDLPQYNEKKFLTTYDTSYICVSNGTVNSKFIKVATDMFKKEALVLPSTKYSLMMECDRNSAENGITYDLCGATGTIKSTDGYKYMITPITTPSTLSHNTLKLGGLGNKVKNVMLLKDTMSNQIGYFEGIQSFGELQDDGKYKVEVCLSENHNYPYEEIINEHLYNKKYTVSVNSNQLNKPDPPYRNYEFVFSLSEQSVSGTILCTDQGSRTIYFDKNTGMLRFLNNEDICIIELNKEYKINLIYEDGTSYIYVDNNLKLTSSSDFSQNIKTATFNSQYQTSYNSGVGHLYLKLFRYYSSITKAMEHPLTLSNTKIFYLDEPLRKISNISDRLYYDYDKGKYCVERNIGILDKSKLINNGTLQTSDSNYTCRHYVSAYYRDLFNNTGGLVRADGFHPNENWGHLLVNQAIGIMGGALMITLKNSDIDAYGSFGECVRNKPFNIYMVYLNPIIEELEDTNQSINVYTPTTYISTNSVIKPSTLKIESKPIIFNVNLVPNAEYTLQFDVDRVTTDNKLTYYLGGTTGNITTENGYNTRRLVLNTPNTIEDNILKFVGEGHTIKNVMLLKDGQVQELNYFDGVLNLGELQEDGKYKIELKSYNEQNQITSSRILTFNLDEQLYKVDDICDKLYWDETKGYFCIDKKISPNLQVLSTPKTIDLVDKNEPIELYPKEITKISCNNEIKPSKIKIKYIDIQ